MAETVDGGLVFTLTVTYVFTCAGKYTFVRESFVTKPHIG